MREQAAWEPLDEREGRRHLTVRTDRPTPTLIAELIRSLDARLG